ncbi:MULTISPECIES: SDR family oxidoreductase [Spongiibacter]|uniref:SDR family NAD(P)-dependent oxidoreductase n=1 Tax=Spongiibacter TaxID=630749 RepID=UPI000C0B0C51|nr:SDR family oxidoreductase [Spongiibacter sp.]MAK42817.1 short-chain dehydrogenase [Spongiibacter sp.]MBM7422456.1 NAD(P)-dependent dehydrogenase (short-subunit alcohol dehydrogenase family) [Spongiibacter marinus]
MNKLVVISGGSQGIGRATVERFLAEGYRVINLSRRSLDIEGVLQLSVDMGRIDWLEGMAAEALSIAAESADEIVLIHNAARQDSDTVATLAAENFAAVLQINLVAPQQLNAVLIPYMKPGSSILYVGSTLAEKAVRGCASYVASKHGLVGLMRATVQDLAGTGIHSACVCPGFTDTAMLRGHINNDPEVIAAITANVSAGRLIDPQEIADTLYFCARSPVISGAVIHANLGQIEH